MSRKEEKSDYYQRNKERIKAKRMANKEHHAQVNKAWREANKERLKTYQAVYDKANRDKRNALNLRWKTLNPRKAAECRKLYRVKLKREVITKYGGKCAGCGFSDISGLSIDHINNDGNIERLSLFGYKFYEHLRREERRSDLRVLCMTCQFMARAYGSKISDWPERESLGTVALTWTADGPDVKSLEWIGSTAELQRA